MSSMIRNFRTALLALGLLAIAGCTTIYRNHGYAPSEEDLAEILVGVDTRATVADVAGAPTTGGALGDGNFYYVQSRFRHFGATEPREIDREVVAISFDSDGVVTNIERFGLEDGQVVRLSRRVTDDGIQDVTVLGQLFSSFGNFDAGRVFGE